VARYSLQARPPGAHLDIGLDPESPDITEFIVGRAFARPAGSSGPGARYHLQTEDFL
jgi:hypothetical protein